jgi:hypothetical protein
MDDSGETVAGFADRACPVERSRKCKERADKDSAITTAKSPPSKALLLNTNHNSRSIVIEVYTQVKQFLMISFSVFSEIPPVTLTRVLPPTIRLRGYD